MTRARAIFAGVILFAGASACGDLLSESGDDSQPPPPSPDASSDADDLDPKDASGGSDAPSGDGAPAVDASDASSFSCAAPPCERYVFVSSAAYTGNLADIDGADAKCDALAKAGDPSIRNRTFIAHLASSVSSTPSGGARIKAGGPAFRRLDYTLVAEDKNVFLNGPLSAPINRTEKNLGISIAGVWTGMVTGGLASGIDCDGWRSNAGNLMGTYGNPASTTNGGWLDAGTNYCSEPRRIYCVEP